MIKPIEVDILAYKAIMEILKEILEKDDYDELKDVTYLELLDKVFYNYKAIKKVRYNEIINSYLSSNNMSKKQEESFVYQVNTLTYNYIQNE